MNSISKQPSDSFYKSPLFIGSGIAITGLTISGFFLRQSYIHQKKTLLMETLRKEPGFHSLSNIQATPIEISQIAKTTLSPISMKFSNISRSTPLKESTLPSPVKKTINRLAIEIGSLTNASSVRMDLRIGKNRSNLGWHMDTSDSNSKIPSIRFLCTLRGPTTRFAQLPLEKRREFKCLQDQYIQNDQPRNVKNQITYMEQAVKINPSDTFFPKVGEVIAFSNETPSGTIDQLSHGAVHASPLSLDPDRVLVIFDVFFE
ncbi:MAG: hypothetical protein JSS09_00665 [Verrucomicrobia bacterium]|nr:hypothetical protein [Verrucomicrobiota bacterium]